MNIFKKGIYTFALVICAPTIAQADVSMNFSGNLTIPQCTINNNVDLTVPFNDVEIQTLISANTAYHTKEILIPVNCPYSLGTPSISLVSSAVHEANSGSIQTSKYNEGLVVYIFKQDGVTPVPLGSQSDISDSMSGTGSDRTLTLNAGVGRTGDMEDLTPGEFSASATMQVVYK